MSNRDTILDLISRDPVVRIGRSKLTLTRPTKDQIAGAAAFSADTYPERNQPGLSEEAAEAAAAAVPVDEKHSPRDLARGAVRHGLPAGVADPRGGVPVDPGGRGPHGRPGADLHVSVRSRGRVAGGRRGRPYPFLIARVFGIGLQEQLALPAQVYGAYVAHLERFPPGDFHVQSEIAVLSSLVYSALSGKDSSPMTPRDFAPQLRSPEERRRSRVKAVAEKSKRMLDRAASLLKRNPDG